MSGDAVDRVASRSQKKRKGGPHPASKLVRSMLVENETVLAQAYVHWGVFLAPSFYIFLGLLAGIFFHVIMGILIFILAAYPVVSALIHYKMTFLVLTDKRFLAKAGYFVKDLVQIKLDKIESANLEEPYVGQLVGYSTVIVRGTGTGAVPISFIDNGAAFVKKLEEIILKE